MSDLHARSVYQAALLLVLRRLAPPRLAIQRAFAFLQMQPNPQLAELLEARIASKLRDEVTGGIWEGIHGSGWYSEDAGPMCRLGWDLAGRELTDAPWWPARDRAGIPQSTVDEIYAAWVRGDKSITQALYGAEEQR